MSNINKEFYELDCGSNAGKNTGKHIGATIASFFIPGLGQLIKGHNKKAVILFMVVFLSPFIFYFLLLFFSRIVYFSIFYWSLVIWVWGFNMWDAYNSNDPDEIIGVSSKTKKRGNIMYELYRKNGEEEHKEITDPKELYNKSVELFKQGYFREASKSLEKTAKIIPNSASVQFTLGVTYAKVANEHNNDEDSVHKWSKKSTESFRKAIELADQYGGLDEEYLVIARNEAFKWV